VGSKKEMSTNQSAREELNRLRQVTQPGASYFDRCIDSVHRVVVHRKENALRIFARVNNSVIAGARVPLRQIVSAITWE
jgi:hypothetical protein